jgi:hypothetical protein
MGDPSMIDVRGRAQCHTDRSGDPLDGLVNMFDLGIVLAVAFLIAALQAHNLTSVLTQQPTPAPAKHTITVKPDQQLVHLKPSNTQVPVTGGGSLGQVYQLANGQLVYVKKK